MRVFESYAEIIYSYKLINFVMPLTSCSYLIQGYAGGPLKLKQLRPNYYHCCSLLSNYNQSIKSSKNESHSSRSTSFKQKKKYSIILKWAVKIFPEHYKTYEMKNGQFKLYICSHFLSNKLLDYTVTSSTIKLQVSQESEMWYMIDIKKPKI